MESESVLTPELVEILANIIAGLEYDACAETAIVGEQNLQNSGEKELNFHLSPTSDDSSSTLVSQAYFQAPQVSGMTYASTTSTAASSAISSRSMSNPTTLMIKNLPNTLTREDLFSFIQKSVPAGAVNFLYMPIDYKNRLNFGYAFVNLISELYVEIFYANVLGKRIRENRTSSHPTSTPASTRPLDIVPARVQGFSANINRLIASPVLFSVDEQSLPMIFFNDVQVSFRDLMNLNKASILYQTKPSVEELIQALISDQQFQRI